MISVRGILAGCVLLFGLAACGGSSSPSPSSSAGSSVGTAGASLGTAAETIDAVDQLQFMPSSTTAHVGDIVEWRNTGTVMHTVTFDSNQSLTDSALNPSGKWQVKFTVAGTYPFRCTIHPSMTGTITVS